MCLRPYPIIAYPNPKKRWIFGSQNQMTTLRPDFADVFFYKVLAIVNNGDRSSTYSHEFAVPEHLRSHADEAL